MAVGGEGEVFAWFAFGVSVWELVSGCVFSFVVCSPSYRFVMFLFFLPYVSQEVNYNRKL